MERKEKYYKIKVEDEKGKEEIYIKILENRDIELIKSHHENKIHLDVQVKELTRREYIESTDIIQKKGYQKTVTESLEDRIDNLKE